MGCGQSLINKMRKKLNISVTELGYQQKELEMVFDILKEYKRGNKNIIKPKLNLSGVPISILDIVNSLINAGEYNTLYRKYTTIINNLIEVYSEVYNEKIEMKYEMVSIENNTMDEITLKSESIEMTLYSELDSLGLNNRKSFLKLLESYKKFKDESEL